MSKIQQAHWDVRYDHFLLVRDGEHIGPIAGMNIFVSILNSGPYLPIRTLAFSGSLALEHLAEALEYRGNRKAGGEIRRASTMAKAIWAIDSSLDGERLLLFANGPQPAWDLSKPERIASGLIRPGFDLLEGETLHKLKHAAKKIA